MNSATSTSPKGKGEIHSPRSNVMTDLTLAHELSFEDLYDNKGLARIDALFMGYLQQLGGDLHKRLIEAREAPNKL